MDEVIKKNPASINFFDSKGKYLSELFFLELDHTSCRYLKELKNKIFFLLEKG